MNLDRLLFGVKVGDTWGGENASLDSEQLFANLNTEIALDQSASSPESAHDYTYQFFVIEAQSRPRISDNRQGIGVWGPASKVDHRGRFAACQLRLD